MKEDGFDQVKPVDKFAPLRLEVAVKLAFPHGGMTVAGLRRERARGNLVTEFIAGKEFVTLHEIEKMRELCRVPAKESVSGLNPQKSRAAKSSGTPDGSSATVRAKSALAALQRTAKG